MTGLPPHAKAKTHVYFTVVSDETPLAFISSFLEKDPTVLHVKGEDWTTQRGTYTHLRHAWSYSLFDFEPLSTHLDEYLQQMLAFLRPRRNQVIELLARSDVEVWVGVWVTVEQNMASIELNSSVWRELMEYCTTVHLYIDNIAYDDEHHQREG